jgi:Trk-type K+ transport system membrane component
MLEDTVLIGGIAFLVVAGLSWLAMEKINHSTLSERTKRLLTYLLIALLGLLAVSVFSWHSQNWKEKNRQTAFGAISVSISQKSSELA